LINGKSIAIIEVKYKLHLTLQPHLPILCIAWSAL
jgi:hypothetical protein